MKKIISRGAEAIIIQEKNSIIKKRIVKSYRLPILDEKLRKSRTKKETKLLEKASKLIPVPKLIKTDEKTKEIVMEYIKGLKLSDHLDTLPDNTNVCIQIGQNIAKLHDNNIIHGDLTTSNMIYVNNNSYNNKSTKNIKSLTLDNNPLQNEDKINKISDNNISQDNISRNSSFKIYFIDFGLGFESSKIEDKAVDLHLIKQALEAKHFKHFESFFKAILKGYGISKHAKETLKRLEAVERRGRYKQAY